MSKNSQTRRAWCCCFFMRIKTAGKGVMDDYHFWFVSSVAAYLSDQVVVQLFGDGLRRGQTSGDLHRPLVQVLPVVVRGAQRAASHGAEDGKNTTHHRWATSHFHLRGNSARCEKISIYISIYLYMYTIKHVAARSRGRSGRGVKI